MALSGSGSYGVSFPRENGIVTVIFFRPDRRIPHYLMKSALYSQFFRLVLDQEDSILPEKMPVFLFCIFPDAKGHSSLQPALKALYLL